MLKLILFQICPRVNNKVIIILEQESIATLHDTFIFHFGRGENDDRLGCRDHVLEWLTNGEARRSVISLETFIHSTRCTRCIIKARLCNSIHRVGCHVLLCFLLTFLKRFRMKWTALLSPDASFFMQSCLKERGNDSFVHWKLLRSVQPLLLRGNCPLNCLIYDSNIFPRRFFFFLEILLETY